MSSTSPATSGGSTKRSRLRKLRKKRARRKALFNEVAFTDTFGEPIENNWHHLEWFDLTEEHDRLLIEAAREHAKTEIFGKALPLFEVGVDPNVRILIVSATFDQAAQRTRVLREHVERNAAYRAVFPGVRIVSKKGDEQFTVERDRILKEPTVLSTYAGGPIPGYRFDVVILDDLVSYLSNSTTSAKRERLHRWVADEVLNSVARGGKVWVIGTRQHHDDEYERLKEDPRFHSVTYPAVDEGGLGYRTKNEALGKVITGHDLLCLWPGMHDHATLMAKKAANPDSFQRQQQQVALPETGLVYRRELVDAALERGKRVRPDKEALQELALDPGYAKRAALLAIQTRSGDRVELWGEYSFTQIDDDGIAKVVVEHCKAWGVATVYIDAEDPGLAATIARELENAGLEGVEIVRVPFGRYKRLAIGATRWLLQTGRLAWRGEATTVYRPGGVRVEKSVFRKEVRDYALDPNKEGEALKDEDHGPDAWAAYAYRWIEPWLEATEKKEKGEEPTDRAITGS